MSMAFAVSFVKVPPADANLGRMMGAHGYLMEAAGNLNNGTDVFLRLI